MLFFKKGLENITMIFFKTNILSTQAHSKYKYANLWLRLNYVWFCLKEYLVIFVNKPYDKFEKRFKANGQKQLSESRQQKETEPHKCPH